MRKAIILGMMILGLFALAGCKKDTQQGQPGERQEETEKQENVKETEGTFVPEDYKPGNKTKLLPSMMKTDKGYYYYTYIDNGIHYYDIATEKAMFLCNKPECRHDGNEFCVATNRNYLSLAHSLYNDKILKYVMEETDTRYCFKVLSIALDGSAMEEVATTMAFEKSAGDISMGSCYMYVHRNKAFLTMAGVGLTDKETYCGVAILDLNTKEVKYLDEEPFGKNNVEAECVTAAGDYFYYCKRDGKTLLLHRYHIENGMEEALNLLPGFAGEYVVLDEDTIAYIKKVGTMVYTYRISTGENTEQARVMRPFYEYQSDGSYQKGEGLKESSVAQLETDGTYVYAAEQQKLYMNTGEDGEPVLIANESYIHVFNNKLEEVALVDMAEAASVLDVGDMKWSGLSYTKTLWYRGEEIYWNLMPEEPREWENYVFCCKRSDFIAGKPEFTFVYGY